MIHQLGLHLTDLLLTAKGTCQKKKAKRIKTVLISKSKMMRSFQLG